MGADTRFSFRGHSFSRGQLLTVSLLVGAVTFVGHAILFPPGYFWLSTAWWIIGFDGLIAMISGFVGIGPLIGIGGSSMPGIALALRGEIIMFYHGCFQHVTAPKTCSLPPLNETEYLVRTVALAVGMVLAGALMGYLIGASIRRVRHRVAQ